MKKHTGNNLSLIAYPMGGLGAGMICLQGTGRLGNISVKNKPNYSHDPMIFAAITVLGNNDDVLGLNTPSLSKVIEGPVPDINIFARALNAGNGLTGKDYGLPRYKNGVFTSRFPFANIILDDKDIPFITDMSRQSDGGTIAIPFVL